MKFKTSTLALSATLAAGLASSAFADATPYADLVFTTNKTYSVAAGGTATGGAWKEGTAAATPVVENNKVVIDSDSDLPLSFVPTAPAAGDVTELKFNVEASYVPATVNLADGTGARCGFAIKYDSTTPYYYLFNGAKWAKVADKEVSPAPGSMFNLTVRLDYRADVKTATYFVKDTEISEDIEIGTTSLGDKSAVEAIDFVGNGSLSTLNGYVLTISSEKIVIDPGSGDVTLVIPETSLKAIRDAAEKGGKDIGTYLKSTVSGVGESMTHLDAQVLFSKTDPTADDAAAVKVKGTPAVASASDKVRVNVVGLNPDAIGGATITYQLEGSVDGTTFAPDNEKCPAVTNVDALEFPKNTAWRFIRVKTSVSYGNK